MDFRLTDENKDIQKLARDFAAREVAPVVDKYYRERMFPRDLVRRLGEMGFLGCAFPEEYGGSELGFVNMVLIIEEIVKVMPTLGFAWNMNGMTCPYTILNWGTEEQRSKYVPDLIHGKTIGFFGLTEAGGGTDVIGGMQTRAVLDGQHYVLNGSKMFISLASIADYGLVFAKTDPKAGHAGVSAFIVERDMPGFSANPVPMSVLGESTPCCELVFEDVRVPKENLLGQEGKGFIIAMNALDYGRVCVAARCLATAQMALELSVKYCNEREAFGQKIGNFQMIQKLIADMVVEIEAARLLVYRAAHLMDTGIVPSRESSIAKYFAAEVASRAAQAAFEIFGGYAVTDEYRVGSLLVGTQISRTGEGSANLQRIMIAQDALGWRPMNKGTIKRKFPLRTDITD